MWLRCQLKAPIRGGGVRGNRYSIFLLDGAWQEWYSGRGSLKGQVSAVAKGMADQIAMVCQGRRGYTPPFLPNEAICNGIMHLTNNRVSHIFSP